MSTDTIAPKSLPITNRKVLNLIGRRDPWKGKILDLGAGNGYFSSLVAGEFEQRGMSGGIADHLFACDFHPGNFRLPAVPCTFADLNAPLPYDDGTFDVVCSIEVLEHLENHFFFIREINRILKPGGVAVITTPNTLNINSRLRSFITGFPLLFDPLPLSTVERIETGGHIHPISPYHLMYAFHQAGFEDINVHTDRLMHSGLALLALFYLPLRVGFHRYLRSLGGQQQKEVGENRMYLEALITLPLLVGRTAIIEAVKR